MPNTGKINKCLWVSVPMTICDKLLEALRINKVPHSYGSPRDIKFEGITKDDVDMLIIFVLYPSKSGIYDVINGMWHMYNKECIEAKIRNRWVSYFIPEVENLTHTGTFFRPCLFVRGENFYCVTVRSNSFRIFYQNDRFYVQRLQDK